LLISALIRNIFLLNIWCATLGYLCALCLSIDFTNPHCGGLDIL